MLAGAFMATILPGTADASQAVVYTTRAPFFILPNNGTFFPGIADASEAAVITVAPGASNANIDFTWQLGHPGGVTWHPRGVTPRCKQCAEESWSRVAAHRRSTRISSISSFPTALIIRQPM